RLNRVARPLPVAAFEEMGGPRLGTLLERERGRGERPVGPNVVDLFVHLRERGVVHAEDVEQLTLLFRGSLVHRKGKQLSLPVRQRINGKRSRSGGRGESKTADHVAIQFALLVGRAAMAVAV